MEQKPCDGQWGHSDKRPPYSQLVWSLDLLPLSMVFDHEQSEGLSGIGWHGKSWNYKPWRVLYPIVWLPLTHKTVTIPWQLPWTLRNVASWVWYCNGSILWRLRRRGPWVNEHFLTQEHLISLDIWKCFIRTLFSFVSYTLSVLIFLWMLKNKNHKKTYIACLGQVLMACILLLAANEGVSLFNEARAVTGFRTHRGHMCW